MHPRIPLSLLTLLCACDPAPPLSVDATVAELSVLDAYDETIAALDAAFDVPAPDVGPRPIAVTLGPARPIAPWFLGLDGDHAQSPPWSDRAYTAALTALRPGSLRYPGGAAANFWNMPAGWFQPGFGPATAPSPALLETFAPVLAATGATPVFTLNVVTSQGRLATSADDAAMVRLQHAMLVHARSLGMPVYLVELGDGLTDDVPVPSGAPANAATTRFPSATDYAQAMNPWLVTFHQGFADARIAVVAAGAPATPRAAAWNDQLLATVRNADALSVRLDLPVRDAALSTDDTLALPFRAWAGVESSLLPRLRERSLDLWVSASGLRDQTPTQAFASTWLQGAVAATLGLLYLAEPTVARASFASATGDPDVAALFPRAYALGDGARATPLGRSAVGVVYSAFARVLEGARGVRPLAFAEAPTVAGVYPSVLGVRVTAQDGRVRALVLHLGERLVAVDLGAVVPMGSRYEQTAAPWATRVTGASGELTTEVGEVRGVVTLAPRSLTLVSP
jgi:hypothetical protein